MFLILLVLSQVFADHVLGRHNRRELKMAPVHHRPYCPDRPDERQDNIGP